MEYNHILVVEDDKEILEGILKHKEWHTDKNDSSVSYGVFKHFPLCSQQNCHRSCKYYCYRGKHRTDKGGKGYNKREILVSSLPLAHTESLCHYCSTSRAQHKAHSAEYHHKRKNDIDCRKGRFEITSN